MAIAMVEQNLHKRFNLQTGRQFEEREERDIETMDVLAARPLYCQVCRRRGHTAATCQSRRPRGGCRLLGVVGYYHAGSAGIESKNESNPMRDRLAICYYMYIGKTR